MACARSLLLALTLGLSAVLPARAEAPTSVLDLALDRIDELYLDRSTLEPAQLLVYAAAQLEREVDWLITDVEDGEVRVRAADGRLLGVVEVTGWEDLAPGLHELARLVRGGPEPLPPEVNLELTLLKGATLALDRYSRVLDGERLEDFDQRLKGTLHGIGARLATQEGRGLVVEEVFEGNPADIAGLRVGDRIVGIDGEPTLGMRVADATARITGPVGSTVELAVERDAPSGNTTRVLDLLLVVERDEIRIPNLSWRVLEGGFGYIRIDHFSDQTELFLERALLRLDEQGALDRGLILDVRDNTGGSMIQSARAADAFVTSGDLVRTVGPDGGKVKGLAEHLWADDDQTEPEVPIVVLQNRRTASGAEILSGALRELERAVVIGDRSFGKGTVQKVYTLDASTRLKLTVARYLLAGGLSIADVGISPDLSLGSVWFGAEGVRLARPVPEGTAEPLLFVQSEVGWADQAAPERGDLALALALRVLARAEGPGRYELLQAVGEIRELVSAEEEQRLLQTYAQRGLDWSAASRGGPPPQVRVSVSAPEGQPGQLVTVSATVTNVGTTPLHRVGVVLRSAEGVWEGQYLPVGLVPAGQTRTGRVQVRLPAVLPARESVVGLELQADRRQPLEVGQTLLRHGGAELPGVRLSGRLRQVGGAWRAELAVRNTSDRALAGVRVYLSADPASGVLLTDHEALLPSLSPGQTGTVLLGLDLSRLPAGPVPLQVAIDEERLGALARWDAALARDGSPLELEPPRLGVSPAPVSAPPGAVTFTIKATDDGTIRRLLAWSDGEKVGVYPGGVRKAQAAVQVVVLPGLNTYTFEAVDEQGLRRAVTVVVRGLEDGDLSSDAGG